MRWLREVVHCQYHATAFSEIREEGIDIKVHSSHSRTLAEAIVLLFVGFHTIRCIAQLPTVLLRLLSKFLKPPGSCWYEPCRDAQSRC